MKKREEEMPKRNVKDDYKGKHASLMYVKQITCPFKIFVNVFIFKATKHGLYIALIVPFHLVGEFYMYDEKDDSNSYVF